MPHALETLMFAPAPEVRRALARDPVWPSCIVSADGRTGVLTAARRRADQHVDEIFEALLARGAIAMPYDLGAARDLEDLRRLMATRHTWTAADAAQALESVRDVDVAMELLRIDGVFVTSAALAAAPSAALFELLAEHAGTPLSAPVAEVWAAAVRRDALDVLLRHQPATADAATIEPLLQMPSLKPAAAAQLLGLLRAPAERERAARALQARGFQPEVWEAGLPPASCAAVTETRRRRWQAALEAQLTRETADDCLAEIIANRYLHRDGDDQTQLRRLLAAVAAAGATPPPFAEMVRPNQGGMVCDALLSTFPPASAAELLAVAETGVPLMCQLRGCADAIVALAPGDVAPLCEALARSGALKSFSTRYLSDRGNARAAAARIRDGFTLVSAAELGLERVVDDMLEHKPALTADEVRRVLTAMPKTNRAVLSLAAEQGLFSDEELCSMAVGTPAALRMPLSPSVANVEALLRREALPYVHEMLDSLGDSLTVADQVFLMEVAARHGFPTTVERLLRGAACCTPATLAALARIPFAAPKTFVNMIRKAAEHLVVADVGAAEAALVAVASSGVEGCVQAARLVAERLPAESVVARVVLGVEPSPSLELAVVIAPSLPRYAALELVGHVAPLGPAGFARLLRRQDWRRTEVLRAVCEAGGVCLDGGYVCWELLCGPHVPRRATRVAAGLPLEEELREYRARCLGLEMPGWALRVVCGMAW